MMYDGMMGGFGFLFMLVYFGAVAYFFFLMSSMAKSLGRIANKIDRLSSNDANENNK